MRNFLKKKAFLLLNIFIVLIFVALPYYIFRGNVYLGGDDTKLFYSYPLDFMKHVGPFSWYHFSSLGWYNPIQFEIPFLLFWSVLAFLIPSKIVLSYLAFSLPMILGFIYFQKFVNELISEAHRKFRIAILIGALFFILSPILMINQLFNFLSTVWLLGLIPIELYYSTKYFKDGKFIHIFKAMVLTTIFSIALFSIPWLLGFAYSLFPVLFCAAFMYTRKEVLQFAKRMFVFFAMLILSQAYWLFGFVMSYVSLSSNSFAAKVVSQEFLDTFTPVVLSTAVGTIIYPLLNLFHRQIAFNFVWDLKTVFLSFYDKTFFLNFIYIIVLFLGIFGYKKILRSSERKVFVIFLMSFFLVLFLFTVNIGVLKDLFLHFRIIPGFVALRNFYDKFAFAFVLYYSVLVTLSLIVVSAKFKKLKNIVLLLFAFVVVINFLPVDRVVDSPLWGTKHTYRAITIPNEYITFMQTVAEKVSASSNMLSIPFGSSIYTVVKDENSQNAYVGSSPVIVFSGVNDISGHMSFNFTDEANKVDNVLLAGDTERLNSIMYKHNINYVVLTRNTPSEVKKAQWVYDPIMIQQQDSKFLKKITKDSLLRSSEGNYELYSAKTRNSLIKSENIYFQRLSPVKFRMYIKNLEKDQTLEFNDSFHTGWKLFPVKDGNLKFCKVIIVLDEFKTKECKPKLEYFSFEDLGFIYSSYVADESHAILNNFSNKWQLNKKVIQQNFDKDYYTINKDGSINVEMVLYFKPQLYFYFGLGISVFVFAGGLVYLIYSRIKNEKN